MNASTETLTTAAVSGDDQALAQLLERHEQELRASLHGAIGSRYRSVLDVEDVLQVTYFEAFLRIRQFVPAGSGAFLAWLRCIADRNLKDAIRELNRKKRPPAHRRLTPGASDESYATLLASLDGHATSVITGAARSETRHLIKQALAKLPADYATVIRFFDLMGADIETIQAEMNRSRGAVYMLRARALDRLAELMGDSTQFFSRGA